MARWLELIHLRSPAEESSSTRAKLAQLLEQLRGQAGLVEATLYSHAHLDGDFALHLVWRDGTPALESATGHVVAETLRSFGPVNHTSWKEDERCICHSPRSSSSRCSTSTTTRSGRSRR